MAIDQKEDKAEKNLVMGLDWLGRAVTSSAGCLLWQFEISSRRAVVFRKSPDVRRRAWQIIYFYTHEIFFHGSSLSSESGKLFNSESLFLIEM